MWCCSVFISISNSKNKFFGTLEIELKVKSTHWFSIQFKAMRLFWISFSLDWFIHSSSVTNPTDFNPTDKKNTNNLKGVVRSLVEKMLIHMQIKSKCSLGLFFFSVSFFLFKSAWLWVSWRKMIYTFEIAWSSEYVRISPIKKMLNDRGHIQQ